MNRLELCNRAIAATRKAGAVEAEALLIHRRSIGVEIERAQVKTASDIQDSGIAIRAIIDRKVGFAYTNRLNQEDVEKTARKAVKASKASIRDENWRQLPKGREYTPVKNTYDKRILQFTSGEAVTMCQTMMAAAVNVDKRVFPAFGGVEVGVEAMACLNSHGVEVEDSGTSLVSYLGTIARSETQVSPTCVEFKVSRTFEPEPDWIGSEAGRLAIQAINVDRAEAGDFPLLLDPMAFQEILNYTLIPSIRGDNVARGKSALKDKVGKKIAGENINIADDGTLPGGLHTGRTDMEGVPKQKTSIIADGTLQGFLYDNYWGNLESKESTGNAQRGGGRLQLPPYGTLPSVNASNIVLKPGNAKEEELIAEVDNGYYVRSVQGAHQSNPETGEFSVIMNPVWRIKNGEMKHAVKGVMTSGNVYDLMKNISLLGKEARQLITLTAPKVIVSKMKVITK